MLAMRSLLVGATIRLVEALGMGPLSSRDCAMTAALQSTAVAEAAWEPPSEYVRQPSEALLGEGSRAWCCLRSSSLPLLYDI